MSDIKPLRDNTKVLAVKKHNEMLSKLFFLGFYQERIADHQTINNESINRNIITILKSMFKPDIGHLLNKNRAKFSKLEYATGIKNFHTTESQNFLNENSRLLGRRPPILSPNECKFGWKTRYTLPIFR